jgi:SAM-dependent methyltransferase
MHEAAIQTRSGGISTGKAEPLSFMHHCRHGALALAAALLSGGVLAQLSPTLDVPYVPTPQNVVDRMLQIAGVKATDYVMDIGCGDGRMVVTAARDYGARGFCNDIDPARITEAKENAKRAGVTDKVEFRQGDLYEVDISKADVLPMYLLESINLKLRPKILSDARPGTRVVSHAFTMGDWKPDMKEAVDGRTIYFWIVPARVDGRWRVQQGKNQDSFDLTIKQAYQEFTGQATMNGQSLPVRDGRIRGTDISFSLEAKPGQVRTYRGRLKGQAIEAIGDSGQAWLAKRH